MLCCTRDDLFWRLSKSNLWHTLLTTGLTRLTRKVGQQVTDA